MFVLNKVREGVYHVKMLDSRQLGMLFWRYQEFYESKYDNIREKQFTLAQHMDSYAHDGHDTWTYPTDFGGFNLPVESINELLQSGIEDKNHYDHLMQGIVRLIESDNNLENAYLIGTYVNEEESSEERKNEKAYFRHEVTHAMFYLDKEYRNAALKLINEVSQSLKDDLFNCLKNQDYPEKTILDEIQAYITTGEMGFFDTVEQQEELDQLRMSLRSLWRRHYNEFFDESTYDY